MIELIGKQGRANLYRVADRQLTQNNGGVASTE
jgi:hypothetical protein